MPTKVLIVCFYFPPAGGGGVQRPLKLAQYLPELGFETHVLAPLDPRWIHRDEELELPAAAHIHRARFPGPRGRLPANELHGLQGLRRLARKAALAPRRLLLPDESVLWLARALPAARKIVRREGIDVVITTSPPPSVHLVGSALKRSAGVRWIADLRDSMVGRPDRRFERASVRAKERVQKRLAALVASRADAIVAVTPTIGEEMIALGAECETAIIPNGADFDDFEGADYEPGERFRITHTGNFFGKRDPRPFLRALSAAEAPIAARFVGGFRAADREWALSLGLGERLELSGFQSHSDAIRSQRDSEALLLLIPDTGERSLGIVSGKLYEYLAARRPILAIAPPEGAAAKLIRELGAGIVVAPGDEAGIGKALDELVERWRGGNLGDLELPDELRERIDRKARVREFAELIEKLAQRRGAP